MANKDQVKPMYDADDDADDVRSGWTSFGSFLLKLLIVLVLVVVVLAVSGEGLLGLGIGVLLWNIGAPTVIIAVICLVIGSIQTNAKRQELLQQKHMRQENMRLSQQAQAQKMQQDQLNELIRQNQILMQQLGSKKNNEQQDESEKPLTENSQDER